MISDLELCSIVAATYGIAVPEGTPLPQWDHWYADSETYGVCCGVVKRDGLAIIAFRGSVTISDWFHDGISETWCDSRGLGNLPLGFTFGVESAYRELRDVLDSDPVVLAGHSLGCAHAAQIAGLLVVHGGLVPQRLVQFAPPRPGMETLRAVLSIVPQAAYHEPDDPVVTLPTSPPFLHTGPMTVLPKRIVHTGWDPLFTPHHIQNIYAGLAAYNEDKNS